jgi:hypothetical protein
MSGSVAEQDFVSAFDLALNAITGLGTITVEGDPFEPSEGVPYLYGRMVSLVRTPIGYGANAVVQYSGTYQVNCNCPMEQGRAYAGNMARAITAALNRGSVVTTTNGVTVSIINSSAAPAIDNADWITVPVSISWFCSVP